MLNALSVSLHGANQDGWQRAAGSLERQGFIAAGDFEWGGGTLSTWAHPAQRNAQDSKVRAHSGIAVCVGSLWYQGRFGAAALSALLADVDASDRIDEAELRGNFALFLRAGTRCLLMNDALGFVRVYVSADRLFYSTSWLAACAYSGRVELDDAAVAEYVLLGASHSNRTPARGVTILPLARAFDLAQGRLLERLPGGFSGVARPPVSFDGAVEAICDCLRAVFTEASAAFPGGIRAALSGGFDSRLIVAGLLACGNRPELFVYGDSASEDVAIARSVAGVAGLPLAVKDKGVLERGLQPPGIDRLVESALFFDGLPNDGIHDAGADQQTRQEQNAGGYLALNGGGGEIFRNFFHLPDRPFHAVDIVSTFYRGFDAKVFRRGDGLGSFEDGLVASMEQVLGADDTSGRRMQTREQVELLYPLFRCHFWMSVNNSVAVRHGHYATPLVDVNLVRLTCRLPLAWKNAGRLEGCLIARLHPGVASQQSAYGFRFTDGPDWRARFAEWRVCMRPAFVRPFINATRRRLRKPGVSPDMIAHCRALLPGEWRMDPLLDLARLPDNQAFARALAVEVVWRHLVA
ncbi:MAG: asparagine synthase [Rhodanobacteraceae bacterium]|nr:MAG: asparagine synthase [Rhodanobacteraceae bacterium]